MYRIMTVISASLVGAATLSAQQSDQPAARPPATGMAGMGGYWFGTVRVGVKDLRIVIQIDSTVAAGLRAEFTSLDQSSGVLRSSKASLVDGGIDADFAGMSVRLKPDTADRLVGTLSQRGTSFPLALSRTDGIPRAARPQTPSKPYPYHEEEVTFRNAKAGITLAGTLTRPRDAERVAAVVLISGSGPQDRDETVFEHKPFLVIADALTRRGVAVLRVDDRGVGRSGGSRDSATSEDYAADALAAVEYLKTRKEVDATRIGLIGHSEGGVIAPLAATRSSDVAFLVLLAAPGIPGSELAMLQGEMMQKAAGLPPEVIAFNLRLQKRVLSALVHYTDEAVLRREIDVILKEELAAAGVQSAQVLAQARKQVEPEIQRGIRPWSRFFMVHDPAAVLREVKRPVLVLNGDLDMQVPARENTVALAAALQAGGNADHSIVILPGLNHLFQTARTGALSEYATIEETFAPAALTVIGDWIVARAKGSKDDGVFVPGMRASDLERVAPSGPFRQPARKF